MLPDAKPLAEITHRVVFLGCLIVYVCPLRNAQLRQVCVKGDGLSFDVTSVTRDKFVFFPQPW
eukprot:13114-Pleurochrysis_carterae.AAC.2